MKRRFALIAALFFACWMLSAQHIGQTASAAELKWGVNGHPFTAYPGVSLAEQLDAVKALGLKSYRVNISGMDHAEQLATLVKLAKQRDIEILPVITPRLNLDLESASALYEKSYRLAQVLVRRFRRDIRVWELGNEMENYAIITACEMQDDGIQYDCGWGPASGTEASQYFTPRWRKVSAVLRGLSEGAIDADPTVLKAMGTAGWGHIGAFKRMRDDGVRWDISVWHHYEGDPEPAFKSLLAFDKPIWVTELNNSGGSTGGQQGQAEGLERMMVAIRRYAQKYRVEAVHIYELFDEPYWGSGFESVMGLIQLKQKKGGGWSPGATKAAYAVVLKQASAKGAPPEVTVDTQVAAADAGSAGQHAGICSPDTFKGSATNPANQVAYGYCLTLGRLPAAAEQWQFTVDLKQGKTALSVVDTLLKSREFSAVTLDASLNDGEVVSSLYKLLLRRDVDGQGMSDFVAQLGSKKLSRVDVALALANSSEFRNRHPLLFAVQQIQ
jgi:hypothetical protein